MNILNEFQKRASEAGLTQEQIATFVGQTFITEKTAEQKLDDLYTLIHTEAGVEKSAASIEYIDGFIRQAAESGVAMEEAVKLATLALASSKEAPVEEVKEAATQEEDAYFQGIFEKGASHGLTKEQTVEALQKAAGINLGALESTLSGLSHSPIGERLRMAGKGVNTEKFLSGAAAGSANTAKSVIPKLTGSAATSGLSDKLKGIVDGIPPILPTPKPGFLSSPLARYGGAALALPAAGALTYGAAKGLGNAAQLAGTIPDTVDSALSSHYASPDSDGGSLKGLTDLIAAHPQLSAMLGGGALGGAAGALSGIPGEDENNPGHKTQNNVLRNTLIGSLAGGGAAYGAGQLAPDMFKKTV